MSASDHDGEALAAIRKANDMLKAAKMSWQEAFAQPARRLPTSLKFTFGKHSGATVDDVIECDPNYCWWLLGQPWFAEKHPRLCDELEQKLGT